VGARPAAGATAAVTLPVLRLADQAVMP
jgi:hypothetical protein